MTNEKKEEISVSEKLDLLLNKVTELETANAEKDKKINMLIETADKARMNQWDSKNPKKILRHFCVSTINGKVVISWKSLKDIVKKDAQGNRTELQVFEYETEDGEKIPLNIYDVPTEILKIKMEQIKESVIDEETGETEKTLRFNMELIDPLKREPFIDRDGKEIVINSKFVN